MMSDTLFAKTRKTGIVVVIALVMSLCALPLTACSGQSSPSSSQGDNNASATEISNWKTLGDALANQTGLIACGTDDETYVIVFAAGDQTYRAIAKMQPAAAKALEELDFFNPDDKQKIIDAASNLELISAEEISGDMISQDELDSYVGKTGQDLIDSGFTFENYYMYGDDQTGASMSHGYYSYEFTFDVQVPEDKAEDEGAAIMSAKVTEAQSSGNLSSSALDPAATS